MMNNTGGFLDIFQASFSSSIQGLSRFLWIMPTFAIVAFLVLWLFDREIERRSARKAIKDVFPLGMYRNKTVRMDVLNTVLTYALWNPVFSTMATMLMTFNAFAFLSGHLGAMQPITGQSGIIVPLHILIFYLSMELGFYIIHYAFHKVPILWSFHRVHHSAEAATVFATRRAHPVELLALALLVPTLGGLFSGSLLYALGTPLSQAAMMAFGAFGGIYFSVLEILNHSHVRISYGRLNRIILAPIIHQFHHSAEFRHRDKNFGATLTVFDSLFGTLYLPRPGEVYRWGLNEDEIGDKNPHIPFSEYFIEPFRNVGAMLNPQSRTAAKGRPGQIEAEQCVERPQQP